MLAHMRYTLSVRGNTIKGAIMLKVYEFDFDASYSSLVMLIASDNEENAKTLADDQSGKWKFTGPTEMLADGKPRVIYRAGHCE